MSRPRYYDPQGKPISLEEWSELFEKRGQPGDDSWWRIRDEIGNVEVSTVWLGLDHNFLADGPPLIFETMAFKDGEENGTNRYSTWEEARAGHQEMLDRFRPLQVYDE